MPHMLAKITGIKAEVIKGILKAQARGHADQGLYLEHLWKNADDQDDRGDQRNRLIEGNRRPGQLAHQGGPTDCAVSLTIASNNPGSTDLKTAAGVFLLGCANSR